jgi:release factor glutamine methyltransferase
MNPVVSYIKQTLQGYYPDSELVPMAKLLLTQVFGMSVVELYAGKDTTFSVNERKQLDDILVRLQKLEPIQYIIGTEEFYGLTFEVNKHVLIPRPETGELVDWIIREHKYGRVRILDIGTGSGCIAVSLAKNLEEAEVVSWDVSEKALQVAERNCRRNGVRVILEQRDVLLASPAGERFDVIVSNPPYITEKERADMSANVLEWEPELALFVPDDSPLLFYRKIQANKFRTFSHLAYCPLCVCVSVYLLLITTLVSIGIPVTTETPLARHSLWLYPLKRFLR